MDPRSLMVLLYIGSGIAAVFLMMGIVLSRDTDKEERSSARGRTRSQPSLSTPILDVDKDSPLPFVVVKTKKCPFCAEEMKYEAVFCLSCHRSVRLAAKHLPTSPRKFASFRRRSGAALLDLVICVGSCRVIGSSIRFIRGLTAGAVDHSMNSLPFFATIMIAPFGWLYTAGYESSAAQAPPGKMAAGIKVTGLKAGGFRSVKPPVVTSANPYPQSP